MLRVHGLYGHIARNNIVSLALIALFFIVLEVLWAVVVFVGLLAIVLVAPFFGLSGHVKQAADALFKMGGLFQNTLLVPVFVAVALLVCVVIWHRRIVDHLTGAREVTLRDEPRLFTLVENLAIMSGLPMPRLAVIETAGLNAYASGLDPSSSTIAVTRGLLTLGDRELEAVLAHEMTHIRHRDTRVLMAATVFGGLATSVAETLWSVCLQRGASLGEIFSVDARDRTHGGGHRQWRQALLLATISVLPLLCAAAWVAKRKVGFDHLAVQFVYGGTLLVIVWLSIGHRMVHLVRGETAAAFSIQTRSPFRGMLPRFPWLILPPLWGVMLVCGVLVALVYVINSVVAGRVARARELMADAGAVELTKDADALMSALRKIVGSNDSVQSDAQPMMISGPTVGWAASHPTLGERIAALRLISNVHTPGHASVRQPRAFGRRVPT